MAADPEPVTTIDTVVVGRRVAQFAIDWLIMSVVLGAILALYLLSPTEPDGAVDSTSMGFWLITLVVVVAWIAWPLYVWVFRPHRHGGRTFAMSMLGLRVVADDGTPASLGKLFVRALLLMVDVGITPLVGLVAMLVTSRHQRIGDLAAGTVVCRTAPTQSPDRYGDPAGR